MIQKENIIEQLKLVEDPEIHIDVWTLGLIYDIEVKEEKVKIIMTLTSPGCPYGPELVMDIKEHVLKVENVKNVDVEVTFEPPWQPPEEVRMMLGL